MSGFGIAEKLDSPGGSVYKSVKIPLGQQWGNNGFPDQGLTGVPSAFLTWVQL